MAFEPKDIYLVKLRYRSSEDPRPCVILDPPDSEHVTVALISSAMDLYRRGMHFLIEEDRSEFPLTGLKKTSFVAGDQIHDIHVADLGKRLGHLTGDLAIEFENWIG